MRRVLIRWVTLAIPVLFIVTAVVFILSAFVPGNAGRTILGGNATPSQVAALDKSLGLDKPIYTQYWDWLTKALHGNLGTSLTTGVPVSHELSSRIGVTAALMVGAVLVAAILGIGLGFASALRGGWMGKLIDVIALLGLAVPNFWFALVLVSVFAVGLHLLPATGWTSLATSPSGWLESLVLPVLALGIPAACPVAKQTRDGVLREMGKDYVRALRARGIAERAILSRHILKNAAPPIITVLGIVAVTLLGGTVLIESVFILPGLGGLAVSASSSQDIPTVQGIAVVFAFVVMVINLVIEILYAVVNPKVRT